MSEYKTCSICNRYLEICHFYSKGAWCKSCSCEKGRKRHHENKDKARARAMAYRQRDKDKLRIKRKKYYEKNKDKILTQQRGYQLLHKEEIVQQAKKYRAENKEAIAQSKKKYAEKNFEYLQQYQKEYAHKNKDKLNEYSRNYQRKRLSTDIHYKLRKNLSWAISHGLKNQQSSKNKQSCLKYLPYTIAELRSHLDSFFSHPDNLTPEGKVWMTWDNHGLLTSNFDSNKVETWVWQIDHIIPHSLLSYTSMEDENFKKCWALENLRPLRADINVRDGSNRTRHQQYK